VEKCQNTHTHTHTKSIVRSRKRSSFTSNKMAIYLC